MLTESEWPEQPEYSCIQCKPELSTCAGNIVLTTNCVTMCIDINRFNDYSKLMLTTFYVLKFVMAKAPSFKFVLGASATDNDLKLLAEQIWIRYVQLNSFESEFQYLTGKTKKRLALLGNLNLFMDKSGLIRCGGRANLYSAHYDSNNPYLLPKDHYFVQLLIAHCHAQVLHGGCRDTLIQLREKFWIPHARQAVRKFVFRCWLCRRYQGAHYPIPDSPQLPDMRLQNAPAFTNVGCDYAGPLVVKCGDKQTSKAYILLVTCAVTRCLHLELTNDLTVHSFILAFRRVCARRGFPTKVISDNAKTFKAASIDSFIASHNIAWHYIVEKAPWWGGFYERLVQSVKQILKKVCGRALLSYDELFTVITECEAVINSRPLTYIYDDDLEGALTPSHFLVQKRLTSVKTTVTATELTTRGEFSKRYRHRQTLTDHFWRRFYNEYLKDLREHYRSFAKPNDVGCISVGDFVIIEDAGPRCFWKFGRVLNTISGRDNMYRAAEVETYTKTKKGDVVKQVLRRPIQCLFPMEVKE